ncbi:hypothetical protein ACFFHM_01085 [Halalkalibacter kiskunsagensis]|uniref:Uncharacterized protein n=1 Tax=Halalkalibacter kiskunsagensis TaxID=1548599 RepID=A0ABV6K8B3_9BACI
MLYIRDIEEIIKETLHEHNLDMSVEFNNHLSEPMSYNVSTHTIKFNYIQVNGYIAKINFKVKETDKDLVKMILYHAIGYYLDFKKNKHDLRILMYGDVDEQQQLKSKIETNAWEYGRTLIPSELVQSYDQVRELDKMLLKS